METNGTTKHGMVAHDSNPSTQDAEARGSQVQGQTGLHSKILSKKEKEKKKARAGNIALCACPAVV